MKKFLKYSAIFILIVIITASLVILVNIIPKNKSENQTSANSVLDNVVSVASNTSAYNGKLSIRYNNRTIKSVIKLVVSPTVSFDVTLDLSEFGIANDINVIYTGKYTYITIDDNTRLKFDTQKISNDLSFLNNITANFTPTLSEQISATSTSTSNKKDFLEFLGIDINNFDLGDINLESLKSLLDYMTTEETLAGYVVKLNVDNVISAEANFDKDFKIENFSTEDILICGNTMSLSFIASAYTKTSVTAPTNQNDYTDLTNSADIIKLVSNQLQKNSFSTTFTVSSGTTKLVGTYISQNQANSTYRGSLRITYKSSEINIQIENSTWYASYGNTKKYGTFEEIKKLFSQLMKSSTNSLQQAFDDALEIVNSIYEISKEENVINVLTRSNYKISFASSDNNLTGITLTSNNVYAQLYFYEYSGTLSQIAKSNYTKSTLIETLTETNQSGESLVTKVGNILYSSKINLFASLQMENLNFEGNIALNFGGNSIAFELDGKLSIKTEKTTTYILKVFQSTNATYLVFGETKFVIKETSYNNWISLLAELTGFDFNNLLTALKSSSNILDFGGKITKSNPTDLNVIMDAVKKIEASSANQTATVSYKANSGAIAYLSFNQTSNDLSIKFSNLKIAGKTIGINATFLDEKTIKKQSNSTDYLDISNLADAIHITNTIFSTNAIIRIYGPLYITLPLIGEMEIDVNIMIKKVDGKFSIVALIDNLPTGIYMNTKVYNLWKSITDQKIRHYLYLYYKNSTFYIDRYIDYEDKTNIGTFFKPKYKYYTTTEKICSGYFTLNDITNTTKQTMKYLNSVIGVGEAVINTINLFSKNKQIGVFDKDLDKLIAKDGYSYYSNTHKISLDMQYITGNSDFSNLDFTIKTSNNQISSFGFKFNVGSFLKLNATYFTFKSSFTSRTVKYSNHSDTINIENTLNSKLNELNSGTTAKTLTEHIKY